MHRSYSPKIQLDDYSNSGETELYVEFLQKSYLSRGERPILIRERSAQGARGASDIAAGRPYGRAALSLAKGDIHTTNESPVWSDVALWLRSDFDATRPPRRGRKRPSARTRARRRRTVHAGDGELRAASYSARRGRPGLVRGDPYPGRRCSPSTRRRRPTLLRPPCPAGGVGQRGTSQAATNPTPASARRRIGLNYYDARCTIRIGRLSNRRRSCHRRQYADAQSVQLRLNNPLKYTDPTGVAMIRVRTMARVFIIIFSVIRSTHNSGGEPLLHPIRIWQIPGGSYVCGLRMIQNVDVFFHRWFGERGSRY
jgi:hypothetical protein